MSKDFSVLSNIEKAVLVYLQLLAVHTQISTAGSDSLREPTQSDGGVDSLLGGVGF